MKVYNHHIRHYEHQYHTGKPVDGINSYCDSVFTFDIECTSAWLENGNVIGYKKGYDSKTYWNQLKPLSLPYIWQFSCNGDVYCRREFSDFLEVLDDLPKDKNIIIWVHNLSYEFHFLSNILHWKSVFARSAHKPIKAVSIEYPNIEFRCSYMLTRLSLATWGEQLGFPKLVGDLDYNIVRTPLTPLTEKEYGYCERDCLVVEKGIRQYIKEYGSQENIPLTQTGTVRRVVKSKLMRVGAYTKFIKKLVPYDYHEYGLLRRIFAGGYTHANRYLAGYAICGTIEHYDFASSYPTVMFCKKYPMSPWIQISDNKIPKDFDTYAYIFHLRFKRISCKTRNTYISVARGNTVKGIFDNGRLVSADEVELYCTEQDYLTISETYEYNEDDIEVIEMYRSYKDYLPKPLLEYIVELYGNKTSLKNVEGMEELYMQSKQYINALFGMSVTAVIQKEVEYNNDDCSWNTPQLTVKEVRQRLIDLRKVRNDKYFLSYSWGCWVTAYARRNLWICIIPNDHDVIYGDTDSLFIIGRHDFSWYNERVTKEIKESCRINGINFELTRPKTPKGIPKPLGVFEREEDCSEFLTLGAKRYVERRVSDNKLHLTVSGINKGAVELLNDDIENFKDGFNFDKDAECVNKRLATYIKDMPEVVYPDGYISHYKQGINLRPNGYKLTMTDEYKLLIDYAEDSIDEAWEPFTNAMRGEFMFV